MAHRARCILRTVWLSCLLSCFTTLVAAFPAYMSSPRPLVIWHGMGDSYGSPGIMETGDLIKGIHPGIFIHSVFLDPNLRQDERAGYYGNVNEQVEQAAAQLAEVEELSGGFDAIGFSQGGQFLRAYVERYNSPPVHNLITFGSQHMGVADIPECKPWDLLCQIARRAVKANVYGQWVQTNMVQAQYFRDPEQLEAYMSANHFLTSINNEIITAINTTYAKNLASLDNLVLVLFADDKMVVPKESAWFGSYAPTDSDGVATIIPMRSQDLYIKDRIGLKTLDNRGSVVMKTCDGGHMHITDKCWRPIIQNYVGGPGNKVIPLVEQLPVQQ